MHAKKPQSNTANNPTKNLSTGAPLPPSSCPSFTTSALTLVASSSPAESAGRNVLERKWPGETCSFSLKRSPPHRSAVTSTITYISVLFPRRQRRCRSHGAHRCPFAYREDFLVLRIRSEQEALPTKTERKRR
ncbi:hypothetical protein TGVEG_228240 [Toxoplasma gondii VEG]|uniref:Uncharacterized protein n=1 Tax=Toxoplasma gondii (strain ATCC 50861 / VEG) TaxID=432359 RepID=V5BB39_TOXGV|nr:hypothetical protein TGVEG_228240 [Toxoplasma gondii VEG]